MRALAVIALLVSGLAQGGSLRSGVTRIDLSAGHPVEVVEVQNTGDAPTLVQVDPFEWSQPNGEDVLTPTGELIATPIVVALAPGEQRKIRIGLKAATRSEIERTFRVVIGELPEAASAVNGLLFAVRLSIPVFAHASGGFGTPDDLRRNLSWSLQESNAACPRLAIHNASVQHVHILRAGLSSSDGTLLWSSTGPVYVLPRSVRVLKPELCEPTSGDLRLDTVSEAGSYAVSRELSALDGR